MGTENDTKRIFSDNIPVKGDSDEKFAANLLIRIGIKNNDPEAKRIGQARLRIAENRGTIEDYELLNLPVPRDLPK